MAKNERDIIGGGTTSPEFVVTNFIEDYTFDANTITLADTSDVLATLIRDLQAQGILKGSVSA